MKSTKHAITTIVELADGAKVYKEIEERCAAATPPKSLRELTIESKVSLATIWRMRKLRTVANLRPLVKIEKVLKRWGV